MGCSIEGVPLQMSSIAYFKYTVLTIVYINYIVTDTVKVGVIWCVLYLIDRGSQKDVLVVLTHSKVHHKLWDLVKKYHHML